MAATPLAGRDRPGDLPVFVVSLSAGGASLLALFNVGIRRQARVALAVAGLYQVAFIGYYLLWYLRYPFWIAWPWALTEFAALVAWGMYIRARRQLVASLRDRAEQAEAAQQLLARQARQAERARIAGEMHDVLGHRVSLMALQAGGLQVRPDLPPEQVRETAGLIWFTAREALEELRGIIGVLRDGDGAPACVPSAPQPSLRDIAPLVEESRRAGMNVTLDMQVEKPDTAPGALGRDACRIVREALTNVSKHARGTAVTVSVSGRAGSGLLVTIRNRLPIGQSAGEPLPGAGPGAGRPGRTGQPVRGHVHARAEPGRQLRRQRRAAVAAVTAAAHAADPAGERRIRVLLVDDDPLVRRRAEE